MIKLYTTGCPKCKILEKKLNDKNISYETITDENIMREKGYLSVPVLEVEEDVFQFPQAVSWVNNR